MERNLVVKEHIVSYLATVTRLTARFGLCLGIILTPAVASAAIIDINPDDYDEHTDLSNISPYVTLGKADGDPSTLLAPVYATASESTSGEPTGRMAFGKFASGEVTTGCERVECYMGLSMTFHQPVVSVSLLAINVGYKYGVLGYWEAFGTDGTRITNGQTPNTYGEAFTMNVAVPGMATLIVGGAHTPELEFDRLSIELPESATWPLLGFGILSLYLARFWKLKHCPT